MHILRSALGAVALIVGLCAAGAASAQTDLLAPAREGQLHCYNPDEAAKDVRELGWIHV